MRRAMIVVVMISMVVTAVATMAVLRQTQTGPSSITAGENEPATAAEDNWPVSDARPGRARPEDVPRLTATEDSKRLYDQIVACFDADAEFFELFEQAPCYEELVNEAALTYSPQDLLNAVKAMVATKPNVLTACHNGGHSAATILTKRVWSPNDPYEVQLEQMRSVMSQADDVCQNGYVHGFYDAIGQDSPNMDSFRAAAEVCYEVQSSTVDCGHGLGHSAWYATKDFKKAAEICGVLEGHLKYRCDDGVIMYLPDYWSTGQSGWTADPRQPAWDPEKFYNDAVEVCDWWPQERAGDPEPLKGCWIGIVAGVLWRPISTLLDYGNYPEIADEAKVLLARAEAACMELPPAGEEYCIDEWPGMVIYVAQNNPEYVKDLCTAMVKYELRCTEESLSQLEENKQRDTETSRNDQN